MCRIGPESRNGAQTGFTVAKKGLLLQKLKKEKIDVTSDMRAASEIAASDSRGQMFSAFTGNQGPELVQNHKTDLKHDQQLPRKLRNSEALKHCVGATA